jgi:hypothetical protein
MLCMQLGKLPPRSGSSLKSRPLIFNSTFTVNSHLLRRYDVELVVCTVLGIAWLVLLGRTTYNLQNLRAKDWAISH